MEKFSKFRDEATGIAPFLPAAKTAQMSVLSTILVSLVALISYPLALISLISYSVFWQHIPFFDRWALTVFLWLLRLFYINASYDGERRSASVRRQPLSKVKPGDIVISNFVSPLDPFVYSAKQPSVFVFPGETRGFVQYSALGAANRALSASHTTSKTTPLEKIVKDARSSGSIVVLFAEGTTSNGRGLLTLKHLDVKELAGVDTGVRAAAIKYTPATLGTPVPRSWLAYLWLTLSGSWWYMCSQKFSGEVLAPESLTVDSISRAICNVGRLRQIGPALDVNAKANFITAYKSKAKKSR